MDNKENVVTPEELAAEQAAIQDVKEDEVRAKVIEEFDLDETTDADRITKITAKEVENRKRLSKAIGQKIKLREEIAKGKKEDTKTEEKETNIAFKDQYALINEKVHADDVEEVLKAAKLLNKGIADALKDPIVKGILAKRVEERETANAANVGAARRTTAKVTPDVLVENLKKGEVPEKGTSDAEDLFWARRGGKR